MIISFVMMNGYDVMTQHKKTTFLKNENGQYIVGIYSVKDFNEKMNQKINYQESDVRYFNDDTNGTEAAMNYFSELSERIREENAIEQKNRANTIGSRLFGAVTPSRKSR